MWVTDDLNSFEGGVYKTTNGGGSDMDSSVWGLGIPNPNVIYFYNSRIGYICKQGDSVSVKKTTDGGAS